MSRRARLIITVISLLPLQFLAAQTFTLSLRVQNDSAQVLPAAEVCGLRPQALNGQAYDWQLSASRPLREEGGRYCLEHDELGPYQAQRFDVQWLALTPLTQAAQAGTSAFELLQAPSTHLLQLAESFEAYSQPERVARIHDWMVDNITFSGIRRGIEGAEHALDTRTGDCTEHMLLAGELLERNGFTIRRVLGVLVHKDQHRITASSLHNWIEYLDDGSWLVFDSSMRQLGYPQGYSYLALHFYQNNQQLIEGTFRTDSPRLKLFLQ
ncbi:transglutaminase-like domain-containing protein [Pseudomonas mendocina]|uniref:transglutaminase-like domain-containing protein n=1 Tax=Ectopseudomonas mendocina TaxID=300 RepID=UPI0023DC003A|nr:transglutaminase-like domain-containing protein [Pseudomonas mendocina]MDF2074563.1 transglutaminase-like domain-containing protein [Pseudomonas mendocina]